MVATKKHIDAYNSFDGKWMRKHELAEFHGRLKKDIESGAINAKMVGGKECIAMEKRIASAIGKMNGAPMKMKCEIINVKFVEKKKVVRKAVKKPAPKPQAVKKVVEVKKPEPTVKRVTINGFQTLDRVQSTIRTFTLPGEIGKAMGKLQPYKLVILISGETHSGKSELGKIIANAFASKVNVAWIDWEQGGLQSSHTRESVDRTIEPHNIQRFHVNGDLPRTLDAVKGLTKHFKVIFLDSSTKMKGQHNNDWIEEFREQHPDTILVPLMQQTADGKTKGGASAEYDVPVVWKTYKEDLDFRNNYAVLEKNRGNKTGIRFSMYENRIIE